MSEFLLRLTYETVEQPVNNVFRLVVNNMSPSI